MRKNKPVSQTCAVVGSKKWVLRSLTNVSHQCGPGSIPSWGSDAGAVTEKGLSSLA